MLPRAILKLRSSEIARNLYFQGLYSQVKSGEVSFYLGQGKSWKLAMVRGKIALL